MSQGSPEDRLVVKWLADYTHFMCDRLNFPHDQGAGLLQEYLELTARASAQQPSASRYEKASSYPDIPASLHETQLAEHLLDPHLATHTQDRPAIYLEGLDRHDDVSTGNNADHLSNSMAIEASSSLPQLQSHPNNQHSGGMMPMDPRQSESSNPLPQPIQAMQDREPIGSVNEYDPLWVQEGNVDPEIVMGFQSRMKFDTLFRHGVIRPGDVLTLQVTIPNNGGDTETEAHLTMLRLSKGPIKNYSVPDFAINVLSDPHKQYPLLEACFATHLIFDHLQNVNVNVTRRHWRDIRVFRGQQDLGNLWWVKQAFHTWRDMKDREAEQTGQHFRKRRGKGKEGGAVHFKGAFGWWKNGVFQPDPDQGRYRPGG